MELDNFQSFLKLGERDDVIVEDKSPLLLSFSCFIDDHFLKSFGIFKYFVIGYSEGEIIALVASARWELELEDLG